MIIPDNKRYLEFPVGEARQTAGSGQVGSDNDYQRAGRLYQEILMNSAGLIGDGYLPSRAAPEKSDRQLAKAIGVSHHTVKAQRDELVGTGQIAQLDRTVGADGKERPRRVERRFYCPIWDT